MEDARKMGKSELFSHFAERFDIKRTQSREISAELRQISIRAGGEAKSPLWIGQR